MPSWISILTIAIFFLAGFMPAYGAPVHPKGITRLVGPGHPYKLPCQAIQVAKAGDTIMVDAAGNKTYKGDVCAWHTNGLTIIGFNGRPHIEAAGHSSEDKAIWVIHGNDTIIRNIELSGAAVPDLNGAGIRLEGANLKLEDCYFHNNEMGILTRDNKLSNITIDSSEFSNNKQVKPNSPRISHNIYIGKVNSFTLRYSYSHAASIGHLVKSRAMKNHILYNRLTEEEGTGSYELDLPNGGISYVIGNIIQQGKATDNESMISFGVEGSIYPGSKLFLVNNTLIDGLGAGSLLKIEPSLESAVFTQNNLISGSPNISNQPGVIEKTNCQHQDPMFLDPPVYEYHLIKGSPCIDSGSNPGTGNGEKLAPQYEYNNPMRHKTRRIVGNAIDPGAFEYGN